MGYVQFLILLQFIKFNLKFSYFMKKSVILFAVIFALISCNKVDINAEKANVEATVKSFTIQLKNLILNRLERFVHRPFQDLRQEPLILISIILSMR